MPKVIDKKQKAEAIARAAIKVFRETGYHRTRMSDIARAAGTGKGTLYEYFHNKADILRLAFEGYFAAFQGGAARAMAKAASPSAELVALLEFALDHVDEWEDHCAVYVDYFGAARVGEERLVSLDEMYEAFRGILRTLIAAGQAAGEISPEVDPAATAELLLSVFDGVVLHGVLGGRRTDRVALRTAALRLLTRGLVEAPREAAGTGRNDPCSATSS